MKADDLRLFSYFPGTSASPAKTKYYSDLELLWMKSAVERQLLE